MLTPESIEIQSGAKADADILPIFFCEEAEPKPRIIEFRGTGFRLTDDLLVTCWHCVEGDAEGQGFAVLMDSPDGSERVMHPLIDVTQDAYGSDLATARIFETETPRVLDLGIATKAVTGGADVWTWGYPLTERTAAPTGGFEYRLNSRWLEGYVTRGFWHVSPTHGRVPAYEVDLPAPEGLSGAPLVARPGREVLGVIYGRGEAGVIDAFQSIDPDTGERRPEVQRVVSFALAHYTSTLLNLTGTATDGMRLQDYLRLGGNTGATQATDTGLNIEDRLEADDADLQQKTSET